MGFVGGLVELLTPDHDIGPRESAGMYLLTHAADMCQRGQLESARESVRRMSEVYPEGGKSPPQRMRCWLCDRECNLGHPSRLDETSVTLPPPRNSPWICMTAP
jgi:hypothetical protein